MSGTHAVVQEVLSPGGAAIALRELSLEQVSTGHRFTEGPVWDPRSESLYFSDIPSNRILVWSPGEGTRVYREPSGKSNGLAWSPEGCLTACEHSGRRISVSGADGSAADLVTQFRGARLNSPNDLVFRSDGRLYFTDPPYGLTAEFGTVGEPEQPVNGLYRLDPGTREPVLLVRDFDRPNGLAFSPDERHLYVADTPQYHLRRFDVASDGSLSGGAVMATLDASRGPGRPDGMKVDVDGRIYCTGPGGIWVLSPAGELLLHWGFPERTANCGWGDRDRRSLFVCATSSVYRLRCAVPGIPVAFAPQPGMP